MAHKLFIAASQKRETLNQLVYLIYQASQAGVLERSSSGSESLNEVLEPQLSIITKGASKIVNLATLKAIICGGKLKSMGNNKLLNRLEWEINKNDIVKELTGDIKTNFTDVFFLIFPANGKMDENMDSWLDKLESLKEFSESLVDSSLSSHRETIQELVNNFLTSLAFEGVPEGSLHGVGIFITQLILVFPNIRKTHPNVTEFHRIFGYMNGFKLEDTRVVIMGQDPLKDKNGTGFAFHKVDCDSTKSIIKNADNDFRLLEFFKPGYPTLKIPSKHRCDLSGWIQQKILMINAHLTFKLDPTKEKVSFNPALNWKWLHEFYFKEISKLDTTNVVFILIGEDAHQMGDYVNKKRHLVLLVAHPSPRVRKETLGLKSFKILLPFLNTNWFFFQNNQPIIDWASISFINEYESLQRKQKIQNLFSNFSKALGKQEVEATNSLIGAQALIGNPELKLTKKYDNLPNNVTLLKRNNYDTAWLSLHDFYELLQYKDFHPKSRKDENGKSHLLTVAEILLDDEDFDIQLKCIKLLVERRALQGLNVEQKTEIVEAAKRARNDKLDKYFESEEFQKVLKDESVNSGADELTEDDTKLDAAMARLSVTESSQFNFEIGYFPIKNKDELENLSDLLGKDEQAFEKLVGYLSGVCFEKALENTLTATLSDDVIGMLTMTRNKETSIMNYTKYVDALRASLRQISNADYFDKKCTETYQNIKTRRSKRAWAERNKKPGDKANSQDKSTTGGT